MNFVETLKRYANGARIISDWLGSGGHTVGQADAQRRADVCLKCPHNKAGFDLADNVSDAIREQVELKNHLKLRVKGEKSLLTCEQCLCPLRLKIWLPIKQVLGEENNLSLFPKECWIIQESQCK